MSGMIAFAEDYRKPVVIGFSPSMAGSETDEVMFLANHLQENAPLGPDGSEAFRMARAQAPHNQIATFRKAIEIAMGELAGRAFREYEERQKAA